MHHFTLIHSHKLSNRICLLRELSLFIFSILNLLFSRRLVVIKDIHIGNQKNKGMSNTSSVCCNRPYIRIYWNVIQLFMLYEPVNGEVPFFNPQYPPSTVSCALFKLKSFTNYAYGRDLCSVLPQIFASRNSISSVV